MLKVLPDLKLPITRNCCNPLMDQVVQLNIIDAGLNERWQRALGLYFHVYDLWVKSKGRIDYRTPEGHRRLVQDAMTFAGSGNPVATRHGDLAAAHLSIDFSDTQIRCAQAGLPPLSADVSTLLSQCADLFEMSAEMEKRVGLLMDYLGKKPVTPQ